MPSYLRMLLSRCHQSKAPRFGVFHWWCGARKLAIYTNKKSVNLETASESVTLCSENKTNRCVLT